MIQLKSVSSPAPPADAELTFAQPTERKEYQHPDAAGKRVEPSRAARRRLVAGKLPPTETVLGRDERAPIYDTDLDPWRKIVSLEMVGTNFRSFIGTGWLVGPRTVITAGHCVLDQAQMGGWARQITLVFARGTDAEQRLTARRFSATDLWVNSQSTTPDFDSDIGCIHLDESPDWLTALGSFRVLSLSAADLTGYLINVAGFPGDRNGGTVLYHHRKQILRVTERRIFYDVDTYGGQSGAPAWVYEAGDVEMQRPWVVGIHAYGVGGTPSSLGIEANSAPRIIPEVVSLIEGWVANGG